tara:strand:- start:207 stop:428 length:222 start_codon:yes stop_codon:yes gene_type:complete
MNNIIYINKDPILQELDNSIDKDSAKRMLAFKHFNNDLNLVNDYLKKTKYKSLSKPSLKKKAGKKLESLKFSF